MSDSIESIEKFDPVLFAVELCEANDLEIDETKITFRKGWAEIFEIFITDICNQQVKILLVSDRFKFLEIDVDMGVCDKPELVYNLIQKAKYYSLKTCANCEKVKGDNGNLLCDSCNKKAAAIGATGTWLDGFGGDRWND
jgi:hypothetical protein